MTPLSVLPVWVVSGCIPVHTKDHKTGVAGFCFLRSAGVSLGRDFTVRGVEEQGLLQQREQFQRVMSECLTD